jgi:hypothetical protein
MLWWLSFDVLASSRGPFPRFATRRYIVAHAAPQLGRTEGRTSLREMLEALEDHHPLSWGPLTARRRQVGRSSSLNTAPCTAGGEPIAPGALHRAQSDAAGLNSMDDGGDGWEDNALSTYRGLRIKTRVTAPAQLLTSAPRQHLSQSPGEARGPPSYTDVFVALAADPAFSEALQRLEVSEGLSRQCGGPIGARVAAVAALLSAAAPFAASKLPPGEALTRAAQAAGAAIEAATSLSLARISDAGSTRLYEVLARPSDAAGEAAAGSLFSEAPIQVGARGGNAGQHDWFGIRICS